MLTSKCWTTCFTHGYQSEGLPSCTDVLERLKTVWAVRYWAPFRNHEEGWSNSRKTANKRQDTFLHFNHGNKYEIILMEGLEYAAVALGRTEEWRSWGTHQYRKSNNQLLQVVFQCGNWGWGGQWLIWSHMVYRSFRPRSLWVSLLCHVQMEVKDILSYLVCTSWAWG